MEFTEDMFSAVFPSSPGIFLLREKHKSLENWTLLGVVQIFQDSEMVWATDGTVIMCLSEAEEYCYEFIGPLDNKPKLE